MGAAAAVVAAMSNTENFAADLVSNVNSAGTAISPLSAGDVTATEPDYITSIDFTVSVAADDTASATSLEESIVSTTSDTNEMAAMANTAKVPGTPAITSVTCDITTVQRPQLLVPLINADSAGTAVDQEDEDQLSMMIAFIITVAALLMACATVIAFRGDRNSQAKEACELARGQSVMQASVNENISTTTAASRRIVPRNERYPSSRRTTGTVEKP